MYMYRKTTSYKKSTPKQNLGRLESATSTYDGWKNSTKAWVSKRVEESDRYYDRASNNDWNANYEPTDSESDVISHCTTGAQEIRISSIGINTMTGELNFHWLTIQNIPIYWRQSTQWFLKETISGLLNFLGGDNSMGC